MPEGKGGRGFCSEVESPRARVLIGYFTCLNIVNSLKTYNFAKPRGFLLYWTEKLSLFTGASGG